MSRFFANLPSCVVWCGPQAAREGVLQRADSLAAMQREHAALLAELAALAEQEAALRIQEAQAETVLAERVLVASLARLNAPAVRNTCTPTHLSFYHPLPAIFACAVFTWSAVLSWRCSSQARCWRPPARCRTSFCRRPRHAPSWRGHTAS